MGCGLFGHGLVETGTVLGLGLVCVLAREFLLVARHRVLVMFGPLVYVLLYSLDKHLTIKRTRREVEAALS